MTNELKVKIRIFDSRVGSAWPMPSYLTTGWDVRSLRLDLFAAIDTPVTLQPGESNWVSSGIAFFRNDDDYHAKILPRSELIDKHVIVLENGTRVMTGSIQRPLLGSGTRVVQNDLQSPLSISLWNRGQRNYTVKPGDRIAYIALAPAIEPRPAWRP